MRAPGSAESMRWESFQRQVAGGEFDLSALTETDRTVLDSAGVDLRKLERSSGGDKKLRDPGALRALFRELDGADGKRDGVVVLREQGPSPEAPATSTDARRALATLMKVYQRGRGMDRNEFVQTFSGGTFAIERLTSLPAEQRALLKSSGVLAKLVQRAHGDMQAKLNDAQLRALFDLLEHRHDKDGSYETIRLDQTIDPALLGPQLAELCGPEVAGVTKRTAVGELVAALRVLYAPAAGSPGPSAPTPAIASAKRDPVVPAPAPTSSEASAPSAPLRLTGKLDRDEFIDQLRGARIHLDTLAPPEREQLVALGIDVAKLARLSGRRDARALEGQDAIGRVFDSLAGPTTRKRAATLDLGDVTPGSPGARAREVLAVLTPHIEQRATVGMHDFVETFARGELRREDLQRLAPELAELGVSVDELLRLAPHGRLEGQVALQALFKLLLKVEGGARGFGGALVLQSQQHGTTSLTAAGKVVQKLAGVLRPYEQQPRAYEDATRALTVPPGSSWAPPISLAHQGQRDEGCYVAAEAMVRQAVSARTRLAGPYEAHYMAQYENEHGHVAGRKADFEAGRTYIDQALDAGAPVLVGVSRFERPDAKGLINEAITDHFVVIYGRERDPETGAIRYLFLDPATKDPSRAKGWFLVDAETGVMFLDRKCPVAKGVKIADQGYQVTQVRHYLGAPQLARKPGAKAKPSSAPPPAPGPTSFKVATGLEPGPRPRHRVGV